MTTYILLGQTFEVSDEGKIALEKYVERIEHAIKKYGQSSDEGNDIFLRIREKLDGASRENTPIPVATIFRVISDIGEPEEIFRDIPENQGKSQNEPNNTRLYAKDFFRREFHRNQKGGIFLGVCAGIGETYDINPLWIRLFFIVFTLAFGFGIVVYLVLAILMPDISRRRETEEKASDSIDRQAKEFAEDVKSRVEKYSKGDDSAIARFFQSIVGLIVSIFKLLGAVFGFVFFGAMAAALTACAIAFTTASAVIASRTIVDMQSIFLYFPTYIPWVLGLAAGATIVLATLSGARAFGRNFGNYWVVIACLFVGAGTIFTGIHTFLSIAPHYANQYEKTTTADFTVQSGSTISIDLGERKSMRGFHFGVNNPPSQIIFERSSDEMIHVTNESSIRAGSKEAGDSILSKVTVMNASFSGGTLKVVRENENDFSEVIPFAFLMRTIRIALPESVLIQISKNDSLEGWYENIEPSPELRAMGVGSCRGLKAQYDAKNGAFICQDSEVSLRNSLIGSWTKPTESDIEGEDGFSLNTDGTATSINMQTVAYSRWEIQGTTLSLYGKNIGNHTASDVVNRFGISRIDTNSLELEADSGTVFFTKK